MTPTAQRHQSRRCCCGVRMALHSNSPALLNVLLALLPCSPCGDGEGTAVVFSLTEEHCASSGKPCYRFAINGKPIFRDIRLGVVTELCQRFMQEAIALLARELVFVHAGVVGWKGRALLLPGRSWSGKTTFVVALLEAGATYYSDEYAVIDIAGRVHPFLRTPRVRNAAQQLAAPVEAMIRTQNDPPGPLSIGMILMSRYVPGAIWSPQPLSCRETLFSLLENTLAIRYRPELSLKALTQASIQAQGFRTDRGNARAVVKKALDLMTSGQQRTKEEDVDDATRPQKRHMYRGPRK